MNMFTKITDQINRIFSKVFDNPKLNKYELVVLKQLINSKIWKNVIEIFYEVDERWVNPSSIQKLLSENGFKNFKKHGMGEIHYDVMASK